VIGSGLVAAGVRGLSSAAVLAFGSLFDCVLYTLTGRDICESSGLYGVTGDSRSGLMRFLRRGGFKRASAAAISIDTLLVDLEWLM
jgi:hypothetical protein